MDALGDYLKRKLKEELIDLAEEGDLTKTYRVRKEKHGPTAKVEEEDLGKASNDPIFSARCRAFDAHIDARNHAQNPQMKPRGLEEQLLFECKTCGRLVESIAEFDEHDIKHKQEQEQQKQQQEQQQQRQIRCRKCRQTFLNTVDRDRHLRTSPRHFCCRYCKDVVAFTNADSLRYHYTDRHPQLYCHFCDLHFINAGQRDGHMHAEHRPCIICHKMFSVPELCDERCRTCHRETKRTEFPTRNANDKGLPDHYARLGISRYSTQEQVVRAAKEMRVKVHPDRRKRGLGVGLSGDELRVIDEEAAAVGMAADVLSDPDLRLKYDFKLFGR